MFNCPIRIRVSLVVVWVPFLKAFLNEPLGGSFLIVTLLFRCCWVAVVEVVGVGVTPEAFWSLLTGGVLIRSKSICVILE